MTKKRVLGIDPGSRITGFGIVEENNGKISAVSYGVIKLTLTHGFAFRLNEIFEKLDEIIEKYKPSEVAFEKIFYAKNVSSSVKLAHARGAAMVAAAQHRLDVTEYTATQIKQAITGYGRASKEQIQKMVFMLLGLQTKAPLDATDALATAICHLNTNNNLQLREKYDRPTQR